MNRVSFAGLAFLVTAAALPLFACSGSSSPSNDAHDAGAPIDDASAAGDGWAALRRDSGSSQVDAGDPQHPSDGGKTDGATDGGNGKPPGATNVTCQTDSDCGNWFCDCQSGPPVNARKCDNHYCLDANSVCPQACQDFGTVWKGTASGGPGQTNAICGGLQITPNRLASCEDCFHQKCCGAGVTCGEQPDCVALNTCILSCVDQTCANNCEAAHLAGAAALSAVDTCLQNSCPTCQQ